MVIICLGIVGRICHLGCLFCTQTWTSSDYAFCCVFKLAKSIIKCIGIAGLVTSHHRQLQSHDRHFVFGSGATCFDIVYSSNGLLFRRLFPVCLVRVQQVMQVCTSGTNAFARIVSLGSHAVAGAWVTVAKRTKLLARLEALHLRVEKY